TLLASSAASDVYKRQACNKTDDKIDAQIEPTDPDIDDAVKSLALRPTTGPASSVAPVTVINGEATKTVAETTPTKPVVAKVTAPAPVVAPVKIAKVETPKVAPVTASKQSAPVAQKGQYLIQLFSVRSEKDAQRGWAKTQSKHKALLSNEVLNLEKADLGERGTYYRVRFGAYDTSSAANSVCSALKKAKQDCLVKKLR
ncbi:MAG: SPOR domain-containing protein, partial [Parvibaculaceae bacterium]|nr:SPOR domain-containing protein [Parvibaculaceae bacterium]